MNLLHQWGFTPDSWKGQRGEYWVLAQFLLQATATTANGSKSSFQECTS
jgi:hypothetical protein